MANEYKHIAVYSEDHQVFKIEAAKRKIVMADLFKELRKFINHKCNSNGKA